MEAVSFERFLACLQHALDEAGADKALTEEERALARNAWEMEHRADHTALHVRSQRMAVRLSAPR